MAGKEEEELYEEPKAKPTWQDTISSAVLLIGGLAVLIALYGAWDLYTWAHALAKCP